MKAGDRRQRWKSSCEVEAILFVVFGCAFMGAGTGGNAIMMVMFFCAFLAFRDSKRGWKIRYDIPSHAMRLIEKGDKNAIAAAKKTLADGKDPNRKRYAFED